MCVRGPATDPRDDRQLRPRRRPRRHLRARMRLARRRRRRLPRGIQCGVCRYEFRHAISVVSDATSINSSS